VEVVRPSSSCIPTSLGRRRPSPSSTTASGLPAHSSDTAFFLPLRLRSPRSSPTPGPPGKAGPARLTRGSLDCRGCAPRIEERRCAKKASEENSLNKRTHAGKNKELKCSSPIRFARHEKDFFLFGVSSSVWDCRLIRRPAKDARRKREPCLARVTRKGVWSSENGSGVYAATT